MGIFVYSGKIEIYTETYGSSANPAVLLIMGATAQGAFWHDDFCEALAKRGFLVIRYDNRDTGKSARIDYVNNPYYLEDLASDAKAILDDYGIDCAHWVGASMGGQISQLNAIYSPHRVKTLTCIMSTPNHQAFIDGFEGRDVIHHGLPASSPYILKYYQAILGIKATTKAEALKMYEAALHGIIEAPEHMVEMRIVEGNILKRLKNRNRIHNHSLALASSQDLHERLHRIKAPTLVIHGSEDFILPIEHGRKLAQLIKGSKFIEYEHMGHHLSTQIFNRLLEDLGGFLKEHEEV